MANDSNYTNVILEEIRSQMSAVLEIVSDNQRKLENVPTRDEFNELKDDVKTIKQAVIDTNKEVALLDRRVTKLEENAS